jgi:SAM-dependent methyltransferase
MSVNIKDHYKELYLKYGDNSKSVQYTDQKSHYERFKVLCEISPQMNSVVDIGCGLAHLYEYLLSLGFNGRYCGLDFVKEFIISDKKKYKDDDRALFIELDIAHEGFPRGYDFVLLSGVFNNKTVNNKEFMLSTIAKMYDACNKGIAFNAMSTYVDYQVEDLDLYYSDPLEIFDYCKKRIAKKVILRHDYLVKEDSIPFEYAIYLYK